MALSNEMGPDACSRTVIDKGREIGNFEVVAAYKISLDMYFEKLGAKDKEAQKSRTHLSPANKNCL